MVAAGIAVLLGAGVWIVTMDRDDDPFAYALGLFGELRRRTTPPGATVSARTEPRARKWSIEIEWHVETEMRWADYAGWLHEELDRDFALRDSSDGFLRYSRQMRADRHLLELRLLRPGPPLRVAVRLVTSAS